MDINRPTIVIAVGNCESVDVRDNNGKLLMRLNIFNHATTPAKPSIDVIFDVDKPVNYRVQSWCNGARVLYETVRGGLVSISKPD